MIAETVSLLIGIVMIIFIVLSVINQQYPNMIIYVVILTLLFILNEIIERKLKKNAQKRRIEQLIEKRVEIKKFQAKPIDLDDKEMGASKGVLVFISYATKDAEVYDVRKIAEILTKYERINDVLYWQEDMKDNIIKYMNDNLDRCDAMLLFCSPNALASGPVEKEWTAADIMGKPIIPIFNNPDHIPPLLKTRLGVQFDPFDLQKNIDEIYSLLLKKIE